MRQLHGRLDLCCINTATLGYKDPIGVTVDAVARAGFGAISPWRREMDDCDVTAVSRQIRDAGLKVPAYCRSSYLPAGERTQFIENLDVNRRALDQAAALGATAFVMVVGSLPAGSRDLQGARAQVEEGITLLLDYARSVDVKLALEPLNPMYATDRSCLNTLEQTLDMADRIEPVTDGNDRDLGVALDVYHIWWDPKLADQVARAGADRRILAFHVCDWLVPTRDLLMDRGMMGDGVIDLRCIRQMVEGAGFDGTIEVEIFATDWWSRSTDEVLSTCADRLQTVC